MKCLRILVVLLLGSTQLLVISVTWADFGILDRLVMPGKVIQGHIKLERKCKTCHEPFKKTLQRGLCVNCHEHKAILRDIINNRGYHGRIRKQSCRRCHTDHKGRKADIIKMNKRKFDHKLTDYPLFGKHANGKVKCEECHKSGKKYRDAPSTCYACHQKDDDHKGKLGKKCKNCHTEQDWKKTRYDHSKTNFPLVGKHRLTKCESCHKKKPFKNTPRKCVSCHKKDDDSKKGHKGRFGTKCRTCHTAHGWKRSIFNHNRSTDYKLFGAHRKTKCTSCHKGYIYKEKLKTDCYSCHKKDDEHKDKLGRKCGKCHNVISWKRTTFDHGLARLPLIGKHAKVKCKECHKDKTYKDTPVKCYACHKDDDDHKLTLGPRCNRCHNVRGWKYWAFNHNKQTNFHLTGKHKGLKCEACHLQPMKKKIGLPGDCNSCHSDDDVHHGDFGQACERCHYSTNWKKVRTGTGIGDFTR